ncbi:hypothetical protein PRIPAC_96494 [Pristionchus pacificus]|uniref:Uncharacterized protein n=1 Tax=Pristionchus pacificus TaxID=54126 RepID=A0A2A6BCR6_PRIPA|nr:hypothetical protein PRIPAC_96494 [Pristionchus pacificus]|eukprot:PDM63682.1 hypothetical protein PRIPAC_49655 [Pristionchus pacificus]
MIDHIFSEQDLETSLHSLSRPDHSSWSDCIICAKELNQNQFTLVALLACAFTAYSLTPCEDFCQGTILGLTPYCYCNENFLKFNRTCFRKCIANCKAKPDYTGCIPSDGIPNAQLWICCIRKVDWQTNFKCDSECWSTALPNQFTLVALLACAFTAYSLTPCEDFCQGTILGLTPYCYCNENFLKFNRTCFRKCIANCKAKPDYTGCIPSDGIPNAQLWICCIRKVDWQTNLKCDSECWSTALPNQFTLVALLACAFTAYSLTPCEDFCQGTILGLTPYCYCNENFLKFNRTCFRKCIANCKAKPDYTGCIPSDGIPNAQLWICCIRKVDWQTNLKCDSECWSTALPNQFTLVALLACAFTAYSLTPCEDFCQGTILGLTPYCYCNENFLKFNRTCFRKCIANCKAKPDYTGCIPSDGIPNAQLWICCIRKVDWQTNLKCDSECWSTALPNQFTLVALLACAFTAYSLTPCEDFCQGTILGLTPYCYCNENFLKFNRTCFRKCIANCKAKPDYTGCIPSDGIPNAQLWICCIRKVDWQTNLKCDSECWSTALPNQFTLVALLACAFTAYSLTPCEDFCQGTILGLTPYCYCNENFLKFNRTCFRKCIANCKAKPDYTGCIPSDGIPNAQLWICCIRKVDWQTNLKCDSECWSTALPNQFTLVALLACAFTAYSLTPCEDFCQGTILGLTPYCYCNENFLKFNRTCFRKCIANCKAKPDYTGCIPSDGIPNAQLWICCIRKVDWQTNLKCDSECWSTALPNQFTLVALLACAFTAYSLTPCEDFCQGTILGLTPYCYCNENFLKFNRTCFRKCIANCKAKPDYTGCIPSDGIPNAQLWICCIRKVDWQTNLKCDSECWSTALPNQFTLVALLACAFTAYSLTPCEDFCQGTILGLTPYCYCNENFLKFNRTCFRKCIANCKAKPDYTGCIPSDGIPNAQLWICCIRKVDWQTNLKEYSSKLFVLSTSNTKKSSSVVVCITYAFEATSTSNIHEVMSPNILRLPLNALRFIIQFAETATIVRMREVSKGMAAIVEGCLAENGVSSMTVYSAGRTDFTSCLSIIAKIRPCHVTFHSMGYGQLTIESIQFLHKVADKTPSIAIEHENHLNNVYIPHPLYIPIIKSILLRECQKLRINDHCRNVIFGATEQQELLQFLNHKPEKNLFFECRSRQEPANIQVGIYSVINDGNHLTIKPIEY